jgi:hypothetical protein
MSDGKFVYVESYGAIWRFGKDQFKRMLMQIAMGQTVEDYAKFGAKQICVIDHNMADMNQDGAKEFLSNEYGLKIGSAS